NSTRTTWAASRSMSHRGLTHQPERLRQMVKFFSHRAGGSGEITKTTSPIYEYGVKTGNPLPPMTDKYPADKCTRVLPKPKGERARYDDTIRTPATDGGGHYPRGNSMTSAPGHEVRKDYGKISPGANRGHQQDRFSQGYGAGSGENARTRRNPEF